MKEIKLSQHKEERLDNSHTNKTQILYPHCEMRQASQRKINVNYLDLKGDKSEDGLSHATRMYGSPYPTIHI
jgi:hypothetical protein